MKPAKQGLADYFTLESRNRPEYFAFVWSGYILVPQTAVYAFYTESDDGSALYIDDMKVVNNDGLHSRLERTGEIALKKGYHKIRVEYFNRTGTGDLIVSVRTTGLKKQLLPAEWLFHQNETK